MASFYTALPGTPVAADAARHILAVVPVPEWPRVVVFVPTRRAVVTMREAFAEVLGAQVALLPRILPLAEIDTALLTLLGPRAVAVIEGIAPAMSASQQYYLLAAQVAAFLRRSGQDASLENALALAEQLMVLQEQCARAGVTLTRENLRQLVSADMAQHWEQSLTFLAILAEHWPVLEEELGVVIASCHEVLALKALAVAWREAPPEYPVFVVGSTASQEATAELLQVIAQMPSGTVVVPGLDPAMGEAEWERVAAGHPLFHVKRFLERCGVMPGDVRVLSQPSAAGVMAVPISESQKHLPRSVWLDVLAATSEIPLWRERPLGEYAQIRLVPCQHVESEARTVALMMREALEVPGKRTALVSPDEGLMTRVAAHLKRYGVTVDRLAQGTLALTEAGRLWVLLVAAAREPERLLHLRSLLHHPLMAVEPEFLAMMEPYWYGVTSRRAGQLPKLPEAVRAHPVGVALARLVRDLAQLGGWKWTASHWREGLQVLVSPWLKADTAFEAVDEALEALADAGVLGLMDIREFSRVLDERLDQPVRHGGIAAHPQLFMLTPIEARLQQFDRMILSGMTEDRWPGIAKPNAWLNLAAQAALGLPSPEHQVSLLAHDVLMLGSSAEVFLTWAKRDQGTPTTRSRFIERLVTFLAMHGVAEADVTASQYEAWAEALDQAAVFAPSAPAMPRPVQAARPTRLPVSAVKMLLDDPFSLYARHVLGLRELDAIDDDADASDFGSLAHAAIYQLTLHWNAQGRAADEGELGAMADAALRDFADRPSTALFWRLRLVRALQFVNRCEDERRDAGQTVQPEQPVEAVLDLGGDSITLHGRLDRLEEGALGRSVGDYKTGAIASTKEVSEGRDIQLLAYAMLLDALGMPVDTIEYWGLPHGKHPAKMTHVAVEQLEANGLSERLRAVLAAMRDEHTPLLATPDRYGHEYDGISRYDEWAG